MHSHRTTIRVRYDETDQMGIVNNARYASYFEIGRTELFRDLGLSYADMERQGVMMPVNELWVKYHRSAHYDELLVIETTIAEMPTSRIRFDYRIYNGQNVLITEGYAVLAFLNAITKRPARAHEAIKQVLAPFFGQ